MFKVKTKLNMWEIISTIDLKITTEQKSHSGKCNITVFYSNTHIYFIYSWAQSCHITSLLPKHKPSSNHFKSVAMCIKTTEEQHSVETSQIIIISSFVIKIKKGKEKEIWNRLNQITYIYSGWLTFMPSSGPLTGCSGTEGGVEWEGSRPGLG